VSFNLETEVDIESSSRPDNTTEGSSKLLKPTVSPKMRRRRKRNQQQEFEVAVETEPKSFMFLMRSLSCLCLTAVILALSAGVYSKILIFRENAAKLEAYRAAKASKPFTLDSIQAG
jgi:hypothetical protein